jgi:hypothetical protein
MRKFPFHFGDLVKVAGYGDRLFIVESFREEFNYYPNETWSELIVDLTDAINGDWLEADVDECMLVADAGQADEYMRHLDISDYPPPLFEYEGGITVVFHSDERPLTPREKSAKEAEERKRARKERAEKIDGLLDAINDYKRLHETFGDEEYAEKIDTLKAELADLTKDDERR